MPGFALPHPTRYEEGRNGSRILVDPDGYLMAYHKKNNEKILFYKCRMKDKKGCPVALTLDSTTEMITRHNGAEHNHDSQVAERKIKEIVKDAVQNAAVNADKNPRTVFQDITASVAGNSSLGGCSPLLPTAKSVAKMVQKKRKVEQKIPAIPRDYEFDVPSEYSNTLDGLPFLVVDESVAGSGRLLGVLSPTGLSMIKNCGGSLYCDGTFEIAQNTQFAQVWVVTIKIEGKSSLPAGFFLVPSKEKKVYTVIFEKLKEILGDTVVDTFHLDFEPGTLAACRNVFPDADIQGCNVHWKRCHRRRLDDLGLKSCSQNCPEVQTFVRKVWAIALVPLEIIETTFE